MRITDYKERLYIPIVQLLWASGIDAKLRIRTSVEIAGEAALSQMRPSVQNQGNQESSAKVDIIRRIIQIKNPKKGQVWNVLDGKGKIMHSILVRSEKEFEYKLPNKFSDKVSAVKLSPKK